MNRTNALIALLSLAGGLFAADEGLDRVIFKERGQRACIVTSETLDELKWKQTPDGAESPTKRNLIRSVTYAFQLSPGAWTQGIEARDRGRFSESAALFGQLAGGAREPEQVVGSFEEGVSLELDGQFDNAGKSFARIVEKFPNHPIILDAQYRLGMALAQAKKAPDAEAVAKKLDELGKGKVGQQAIVRAAAIRAALAQAAGKDNDFRTFQSKASFSPEADRASWLHFNLYLADSFRAMGKGKDAVTIYDRMLRGLANDPGASARVRLGIGVCKAETDPQGAILDLMTLDALPYGSPDQKCEARYHAGRLLLAEALEMQKDPATAKDERKSGFVKENLKTARLLLSEAADATTSIPAKGQAAELLKTLPSDAPAVKADAPKADAPKADAPKADAPKADAPKADAPKADAPKADAPKKAEDKKPDAPKTPAK